MLQPTVLLGIGRLGAAVLDRVRQSLPEQDPLLRLIECAPARVSACLGPALEELLRAGLAARSVREPHLDIMAFAAALQCGEDDLLQVVEQVDQIVAGRFGVMFPADRPPEQRRVALHLVVVLPALVPGAAAIAAIERVRRVEAHIAEHPFLARIWLLSQQSTAGTLDIEGLTTSCAAFALATLGAGLREEDPILERMGHLRESEGRVAFFSAASLEVHEARLRRYALHRAAWDGLSVILERIQARDDADPGSALAAVSSLEHGAWFQPFSEDSELVSRCRGLAASLTGADPALPARTLVGPLDDGARIRELYPVLFLAGTRERIAGSVDVNELETLLGAMDQAEARVLETAKNRLDRLFSDALGPDSGLKRLADVDLGLKRVAADLQDGESSLRELGEPMPRDADPLRQQLEDSVSELPSRGLLAWSALAAGLGTGLLASMATLAWRSADRVGVVESTPEPVSTAFPTEASLPWLVGLGVALLVSIAWFWIVGVRSRREVRELLQKRVASLRNLWSRGGGGRSAHQADEQLHLRRRRTRRNARLIVEQATARLEAVRHAILDGREREREALVALGVQPAPEARHDELGPLLGPAGLLHAPLLDRERIRPWIARGKQVSDPQVWADRLVQSCWPAGGLFVDVPCGDMDQLHTICAAQVASLGPESASNRGARSPLDDPEAQTEAARKVADFLARAATALAPPCTPRDPHGNPATGLRSGEILAVAPLLARDSLLGILGDAPLRLPMLWTSSRAARVLILRTWEGHRVQEILWGAGLEKLPLEGRRS